MVTENYSPWYICPECPQKVYHTSNKFFQLRLWVHSIDNVLLVGRNIDNNGLHQL